MSTKQKMHELILLEVQDAKLKAFDKILHTILKEQSSEEVFLHMNELVLETYNEYKKDVQKVLEMYLSSKYTNDPSMVTFLKNILPK